MPIKKSGWRSALVEEIDKWRNVPFEWGTADCTTFAADCVKAMTDYDPAAEFRGKYSTQLGAQRLLHKKKLKDHIHATEAQFARIPSAKATVGDLALITEEIEGEEVQAIGIVTGPEIAVMTPKGLGLVPLDQARMAFRVG